MISAWPPPSITGSSAVTTNSPASSFRSRVDIRCPPGRRLLVAAGDQVDPRRGALQAVVDRRAQVVDVVAPHRQLLRALKRPEPNAAHLWLDLAVPLCPHAAARPVAQRLGARHRADQPGGMQHALAAHLTAPYRALDRVLDGSDDPGPAAPAGTFSRRSSVS